jgi:hypothetical protein
VDSPDVLSLAEISRRLSQVREGEAHLRRELPVGNPHNAILRLRDITRYIGATENQVFLWFPTMVRMQHRLRDRPPPTKAAPMPERWQREWSRFFKAYEAGQLVKAQVGGEWQIIGRTDQTLAQVDAAPRPQAHARVIGMRIDMTTLGPRLKGN